MTGFLILLAALPVAFIAILIVVEVRAVRARDLQALTARRAAAAEAAALAVGKPSSRRRGTERSAGVVGNKHEKEGGD